MDDATQSEVKVVHAHLRLGVACLRSAQASVRVVLSVLQHMFEDQRVLRQQPVKEGGDAHGRLVICSGVSHVVVAGRSLVADLVGDSAMWKIGGRGSLWKCHAPGPTVLLNLVVTNKDKVYSAQILLI